MGNFSKGLAEELKLNHWPRTNGQAPSFSSSIVMKRNIIENALHDKKINFSVSLLVDYYQIYGSDSVIIQEGKDGIYYPSVNVITASPYEEFEEIFKFVEQKIKDKYPNHKIIPFRVGQFIIDGLQVRYLEDENCSVNKALFNNHLSEEPIKHYPRGDQQYRMEIWKKK